MMRRVVAALAALPAFACLQQVSTGPGTDTTASVTPTTTTSSGSGATPTGSSCGTDPQTQVTLCAGISTCPGLVVDQGALPNCGFQIHPGSVIDLECLCGGDDLCPIGVPNTCAQATQLLSTQSSLVVCEQASEGRCTAVGSSAEAGAAAVTTPSSCDKQCETECAGEPDCIQLCGC